MTGTRSRAAPRPSCGAEPRHALSQVPQAADAAAADAGSQQGTAAQAAARTRRAKARVACAASLLRWIYCMVVHDTRWDPAAASGAAARHQAEAA